MGCILFLRPIIHSHARTHTLSLARSLAYHHTIRMQLIILVRLRWTLRPFSVYYFPHSRLGFRLEFLGTCVVTFAAAFAVFERASINPGMSIERNSLPHTALNDDRFLPPPLVPGFAGLSIAYALQLTGSLNWMVRMVTESETQMVSVERVLNYGSLPSEAPEIIDDRRPRGTHLSS